MYCILSLGVLENIIMTMSSQFEYFKYLYIETFVRYKLKKCGTDFENGFDSTGYKMTLLSNYSPFKTQHKVKVGSTVFPK